MITFVAWKWSSPTYRTRYTAEHANIWNASLRRNFKGGCRTVLITDDPAGVNFETFPIWHDLDAVSNPSGKHLPSCYRRLKIFSPLILSELDIDEGSRVVSMDLDVVIVANVDPMFDREEDFVGWRGVGSFRPVVYNGTLFMFRAGTMAHLWDDFDSATSPDTANRSKYFGSDQGWLSYKLGGLDGIGGWSTSDGILSYTSDVSASRRYLPAYARIVSFNGKRKPWDPQVKAASPWIAEHWRL